MARAGRTTSKCTTPRAAGRPLRHDPEGSKWPSLGRIEPSSFPTPVPDWDGCGDERHDASGRAAGAEGHPVGLLRQGQLRRRSAAAGAVRMALAPLRRRDQRGRAWRLRRLLGLVSLQPLPDRASGEPLRARRAGRDRHSRRGRRPSARLQRGAGRPCRQPRQARLPHRRRLPAALFGRGRSGTHSVPRAIRVHLRPLGRCPAVDVDGGGRMPPRRGLGPRPADRWARARAPRRYRAGDAAGVSRRPALPEVRRRGGRTARRACRSVRPGGAPTVLPGG